MSILVRAKFFLFKFFLAKFFLMAGNLAIFKILIVFTL